MRIDSRATFTCTALGLLLGVLPAQLTWTETAAPQPGARRSHAMTYDPIREVVVLFGGWPGSGSLGDTWEWNRRRWIGRRPSSSPPARSNHALVFDAARGRTVLFGGTGRSDTWEWDGTNWRRMTPATSPPAGGCQAVFDTARNRTVVYTQGQTWEWDGTTWTDTTPTGPKPSATLGFALTYDVHRQRTVLFGGWKGAQLVNETWEWDGTAWTNRTPASGNPPALHDAALTYAFDRRRTVLFGGAELGPFPSRATYEWDGTSWQQRTPGTGNPEPRYNHAMAYDISAGQAVLFGGEELTPLGDTHTWDGTRWTDHTLTAPGVRSNLGMAYDTDRDRVVLFGGDGSGETWEFDGSTWTEVSPVLRPPAAGVGDAMAYDPIRKRTVLLHLSGETWEWDGAAWEKKSPVLAPPPRAFPAMGYDSTRGEIVVFGGRSTTSGSALADTWSYDGSTWTDRTPATGNPPARYRAAMAFDAHWNRMVLFGGWDRNLTVLGDTFAWNGTGWTDVTPAAGNPVARHDPALAYHAARQRVVLFGGARLGPDPMNDLWEWDGAKWSLQTTTLPKPIERFSTGMVYDAARRRLFVFGGESGFGLEGDTWLCSSQRPATVVPFGTGCLGSAGVPQLVAHGRLPWIGDAFDLEVTGAQQITNYVLLALGASRIDLPLVNFGAPGCTLYPMLAVSPLPITAQGGRAEFHPPIPNNPALVGSAFFLQAFVPDLNANAFGFAATNALAGSIGQR